MNLQSILDYSLRNNTMMKTDFDSDISLALTIKTMSVIWAAHHMFSLKNEFQIFTNFSTNSMVLTNKSNNKYSLNFIICFLWKHVVNSSKVGNFTTLFTLRNILLNAFWGAQVSNPKLEARLKTKKLWQIWLVSFSFISQWSQCLYKVLTNTPCLEIIYYVQKIGGLRSQCN